MILKSKLKKLIERWTNIHIYRSLPRGIDLVLDITKSFPNCHIDIIFDVGANVGQSSEKYIDWFPTSHIYCFEPASDTFHQLKTNIKGNKRIDCYQLALGSSKGKGILVLQGSSNMFYILGQSKLQPMNNDVATESVDVVSLDEFCCTKNINYINFLKIDTEGGDLEVLKGAVNMLNEQRIDFIEVEAGMNPNNERHVPFDALKNFLESNKYFLFGIYKQVNEWPTREPHLRRANLLFVSHRMIEMNRISVRDKEK